jgi:serine protease
MNSHNYKMSGKLGYVLFQNTGPAAFTIILLFIFLGASVRVAAYAAAYEPIPAGYSSRTVHVRFQQGTDVSVPEQLLPPDLSVSVANTMRLFNGLTADQLYQMKVNGELKRGEALPDLNLWFKITLRAGADAPDFMEKLKGVDSVDTAQYAPLPPPMPATTPDFTTNQGYLGEATDGIDARYSWTVPGGNGTDVKIYDVEYSWNQNHEDLSKAQGIPLLLDPGDSSVDPFADDKHGTAVLGELVADNDAKGVTGISWGADVGLAPANTRNLGYNPAHAILLAVADGAPGNVILIEQQATVCNLPDGRYGPSEWILSVFDAIRIAVANGFVVVEAAGNGAVDLDQPACSARFNRSVRDSGAIIVGAAGSPASGLDRQRLSFSSFGSRVDMQGWGESVATTGYGFSYRNPDDFSNPNFWYTNSFGGTSSASPIVAGAAANLQGIALKHFSTPFSPAEIRDLLMATGNPQLGNTAEHIGPRPDLKGAISRLSMVVNNLVSFAPIEASFKTTFNTVGCPSGFVGKFIFDARLTNKDNSPPVSALMARVTALTNGNLLQNADAGPAGVGAILTIPNNGRFSDGLLTPGESVDVRFNICLRNSLPFIFFVDVSGLQAGNISNLLVLR